MLSMNPNMSPSEMKSAMQIKSIADVIIDPQAGSPNLLLYVGEGSGGGYIPEPYVPVGKPSKERFILLRGYSFMTANPDLEATLTHQVLRILRKIKDASTTQDFFLLAKKHKPSSVLSLSQSRIIVVVVVF